MKVLHCLLICQCFASLLAHCPSQPAWHAKFSEKGEAAHNDGEAFFNMPVNRSEAVNQGWVVAEINDHETVLCLPDDPRVGIIFGNNGLLAGVDVGMPVADLTSQYMVKDHPEFFNTTRLGQDVVVSRMYFVNPAELREGGRRHLHDSVLWELWLKKGNESVNIPTNQTVLEQTTLFTREACIPAMGRHYYYNISVELSCQDYKPWFLLFDDFTAELIGCGFQMFGNYSSHIREWFENIPPQVVKIRCRILCCEPSVVVVQIAIPNSPHCLTVWVEDHNMMSEHFYFRSTPWAISCNSST